MLSRYELKYIILAEQYSPGRKIQTLKDLKNLTLKDKSIVSEIKKDILNGSTEDEILKNFEEQESQHWIEFYGHKASADLLTIGKVQPETLLAMSSLPEKDFRDAIKIATKYAKRINDIIIEAEADLNMNLIPEELI